MSGRLAVAIAIVVAATSAAAQQPTRATGLIAGRIVEASTTTPVADAVVSIGGVSSSTNPSPLPTRRVLTSGDGRFLFRDLPAGTYAITVAATGYVNGRYGLSKPIQIARSLDLPRTFELADGEVATGLTIPISKQGGIGGVVVDESNEPMVGVDIWVMTRVADWSGTVMQQAAFLSTDDRGVYHADLMPGDYVVCAPSFTTTIPVAAVDAARQAVSEGPQSPAGVQFSDLLRRGGAPSLSANGVSHGGFFVSARATGSPVVSPDGVLMVMPTSCYANAPSAASATAVTIGSAEEKIGVNLQLRPIAGRRVSGQIVGPSGPMPYLGVMLVVPDPANDRLIVPNLLETYRSITDSSGRFTLLGVPPGRYVLRAIKSPVETAPETLAASEPITVGDTHVDDLTVVMRAGATFSGRVAFEGAAAVTPSLQNPVVITPRAVPGSAGSFLTATGPMYGRVDGAGRFVTPQFVPGPYIMTVANAPKGWFLKSVMTGGQDALDVPIELTADGVRDLIVTFIDRTTTIAGTARDNDGRPAPGGIVAVFPVDKALWRRPGLASRRTQVALPGRSGQYAFSGLPAGEYFVVATVGASVDFSDPRVLTSLMPSAQRVLLADGESKTQDLRAVVLR